MDKQEVYRMIKEQVKIVDYASRMGFTVVRRGRYFSLKEHDSVIINPEKNCFWRNSKMGTGRSIGKGGSIIDFVLEFTAGKKRAGSTGRRFPYAQRVCLSFENKEDQKRSSAVFCEPKNVVSGPP